MSQSAALRKRILSHNRVPWLVFTVTVLSSIAAWLVAYGIALQRDNIRFKGIYSGLQDTITERINDRSQLGLAAAAFMGSLPNATQKDFGNFLLRQSWAASSSEVGAISFLVHVPPGGGSKFLEYAKEHGAGDVKIDRNRDGVDRVLSLFRQPVESGMASPGFDATSLAARKVAIEQARDTGLPVATEPVILRSDQKQGRPSIVIFIPIYSTVVAPLDLGSRRRSIVGYIGVAMRMAKVLGPLLDKGPPQSFVTIWSGLASKSNPPLFSNLPPNYDSKFRKTNPITLFGRPWNFNYVAGPAFEASSGEDSSLFILGGGLVFALVLFFLTNSQVKIQKELAGYTEEIERRASAESLLAHTGNLFSSSDDYQSILEQIGKSAVPSLADLCSVDVLDQGEIREIALYCLDPAELEAAKRINSIRPVALTDEYGIGKALRTGKSELVSGVSPESLAEMRLAPELVEYIVSRGFTSAMFVPISVRGAVFGSLTLITGPGKRNFTLSDLRQMEEVAERIGLAIDNSRLFRSAQRELEEKVKAEEALQKLNEELEQVVSDRTRELSVAVEELEAFCYSVSHDLRAPLRSVDGFSKALMEDYHGQLDIEGVDFLNRIRSAAQRMDQLITAMLTLSRLTRAEISPVQVDVTEMALEIVQQSNETGQIDFQIQPGMSAFADPQMLRILLENLVSNAVKFSGKVAAQKIQVGKKGDVFFIKDNGAGFDPRYSNKLFQPFERLHSPSEFPGSGIGLATVSRVVRRHGGRIWAESEPGKGATFYFTLAPEEI